MEPEIQKHVAENNRWRSIAIRQTVQRTRIEFAEALATCQLSRMAISVVPQLIEALSETLDELDRERQRCYRGETTEQQ